MLETKKTFKHKNDDLSSDFHIYDIKSIKLELPATLVTWLMLLQHYESDSKPDILSSLNASTWLRLCTI